MGKAKMNLSLGFIEIIMKENGEVISYRFYNHPDNARLEKHRAVKDSAFYRDSPRQEYRTDLTIQQMEQFYKDYTSANFDTLYNYAKEDKNFEKILTASEWFWDNATAIFSFIAATVSAVGAGAVVIYSASRNFRWAVTGSVSAL